MVRNPSALSFRHMLTGAIDGFLAEQGFVERETSDVVAELSIVLAHYREEGAALHPVVFLCDDVDALMARVAAKDALALGRGAESPETVRQAIKTCAPLAQGGWSVFLERDRGGLRFGVFRTDDFVLQESPLEVLRRTDDRSLRTVAAVRLAEDVIELCGCVGASRNIYLSGARTDVASPGEASRELLHALTRSCDEASRDGVRRFYRRVLLDVMRAAHGTLLAVVAAGRAPGELFDDGVLLPAPLDLGARIVALQTRRGEEERASLQGMRSLLRGMMASDGITLLRSDGAILGFNVFVPHASGQRAERDVGPGGARRRTFGTLVGMLGRGLSAVFVRSQDGYVECRREAD